MENRRSILIVGGGTAGWLTACYLAKFFDLVRHPSLSVTLVESPDIGIVGVGEGAFPTIRTTLQFLGIDEYDFIRRTSATFKQGIRFDDWVHTPVGGKHSHFIHPFEAPLYAHDESLVSHWLAEDPTTRPPFAEAVTIQHCVSEQQRGPKTAAEGGFAAPLNYAYHFDAAKLAGLLAARGQELGVRHVEDKLVSATIAEDGTIDHLQFDRGGRIEADLYIDCTGLRAELIGAALGEPFLSAKRHLFTDRALACRVPNDCADAPLPSYTIAAAHEAGWLWDIGLRNTRGVGCVYSSAHIDEDRARAILAAHPGVGHRAEEARLISFEPGWRVRQWVGNCVAVGMSGGFVEPLESTGIVVIEAAAAMIAELFPFNGPADAPADRFNALMTARYDNLVNFLKLHYCLSRRDEPFWRDNADPASIPDPLKAMLERWRFRPPGRFDFLLDVETFAFFNYQYVLYGMEFRTERMIPANGDADSDQASIFARIRNFGDQAIRELPSHRDLVEQINAGS
ncbi:tryptophan halogenase family protein [Sphingomonas bacterium]|uniref:tryptophan halogenase family protein n=1 Tax=Sphingomonas bacterium TaxID=1895847 RepID=UPI00260F9BBA|nr:tryptophan halogenase family protein [Sphingomonas bacterium]MDB5679326.1 tryptophan halogenase [Sphingomonas bacterium]